MFALLVIVGVALLSWCLTGVLRRYALHYELLDLPNSRSSHKVSTPRGGGLAIVLSFFVAVVGLFVCDDLSLQLCLIVLLGGTAVAGIGFWDDHGHVPARWRLLVHFISVACALFWCGGVPNIIIAGHEVANGPVAIIVAVISLVWFLNLFNFMDGIDGIAAVEVICVCGSAVLLLNIFDGECSLILLALSAACFGFLLWNWPPAKIFMGDVGSGFLGYCLGVIFLFFTHSSSMTIWSCLILFGVFWVDATVTLLQRLRRGDRIYEAHRSHSYQILARRYSSHKKVTLGVLLINVCWLLPWAFISVRFPEYGVCWALLALLPLCWLSVNVGAGIRNG